MASEGAGGVDLVPCPNGCEAGSVERCSLERHLLECPLQLVGCEYAAMGCAVRLPRREMSEHIRQSGQEHLLKMCAANLTVSRELSRKVEEKEQQIAELREEMRRMEGRVEERMKEMEGRLTKKVETVQLQVTDIHSEVAITVPPVEYTIHRFSALKAQDKEWQSPPFYTRPGEYKMRMGVWPNGLGKGKRSHVAIRFYTMADAHTEYLKWPATLPVTIRLLNQTTGRWERESTNGSYFGRRKPSFDLEHRATNWDYLSHSELAPYVKDDCLCIRVTKFTVG